MSAVTTYYSEVEKLETNVPERSLESRIKLCHGRYGHPRVPTGSKDYRTEGDQAIIQCTRRMDQPVQAVKEFSNQI